MEYKMKRLYSELETLTKDKLEDLISAAQHEIKYIDNECFYEMVDSLKRDVEKVVKKFPMAYFVHSGKIIFVSELFNNKYNTNWYPGDLGDADYDDVLS